jgi:hypothetical protein
LIKKLKDWPLSFYPVRQAFTLVDPTIWHFIRWNIIFNWWIGLIKLNIHTFFWSIIEFIRSPSRSNEVIGLDKPGMVWGTLDDQSCFSTSEPFQYLKRDIWITSPFHIPLPLSAFLNSCNKDNGIVDSTWALGFGNGRHDILASPKRSITGIHVLFGNNVGFAWTVFFLE